MYNNNNNNKTAAQVMNYNFLCTKYGGRDYQGHEVCTFLTQTPNPKPTTLGSLPKPQS